MVIQLGRYLVVVFLLALVRPLCTRAYQGGYQEGHLHPHFYDKPCPKVKEIVQSIVAQAVARRDSLGPSISGSNHNIPATNDTLPTIKTKFKRQHLFALSGHIINLIVCLTRVYEFYNAYQSRTIGRIPRMYLMVIILSTAINAFYVSVVHNDILSISVAAVCFLLSCACLLFYLSLATNQDRKKIGVYLLIMMSVLIPTAVVILTAFERNRVAITGWIYVGLSSLCSCYGPISIRVRKTRMDCFSSIMELFKISGCMFFIIYALGKKNIYLMISSIIGFGCAIVSLLLYYCYNADITAPNEEADIEMPPVE